MCRLMYLPAPSKARRLREPQLLLPWMESMSKSFGGDGCGVASIPAGSRKGVNLTEEECVDFIAASKSPVVWHTRRISCGSKSDGLCHPFKTDCGWLVHNGHWPKGAFAAGLLQGDWSDSKAAAHHAKLYGWDSLTRHLDCGVWLHLVKGGCQVCYRSGDLYVERETGAVASEPCEKWGDWAPALPGVYQAGQRVPANERLFTQAQPGEDEDVGDWIRTQMIRQMNGFLSTEDPD